MILLAHSVLQFYRIIAITIKKYVDCRKIGTIFKTQYYAVPFLDILRPGAKKN